MSDPPNWFAWIADICSVLGLAVTAVLTAGAWQVRKQLFVYPQHAAKLDEHCSQISIYLNDFTGFQKLIGDEIGKTQGDLNSLRPFLRGSRRESLNQAQQSLLHYEQVLTEEALWASSKSLYRLHAELENLAQGL